ncbi:immune-associated nucleotide-binding protein 7 [Plakobranchus ocellatus]|uniref:Immune-associated nucleotide-binding protein 7 n=1 Tax=Plakobranchus ocellatus TaxID=259542 RepID=A0AAV4B2M1_9GAST|nr:immune-associated nucleotide-binding protein 7 [Plakobranchus ocellatus]
MDKISDTDLLLIGKTGTGKSELGNSILKRKVFKSCSSASSVTTEIDYEVSDYKGKIIKVVDGPGVGDTRLDTEASTMLVVNAMERAIVANTRGYHAFLLVIRFGVRFTAEDQDTVALLKKIFGSNFVRQFCILVMTGGDNFEREAEDTGKTFDQWCREQGRVFRDMMKEFGNRIVLFDNLTKDEGKCNKQIDHLLSVVNSLKAKGVRYTDKHFELARQAREKAIVESKEPRIREEIMQATSLILQKLEWVKENSASKHQIDTLKQLHTRCGDLIKYIKHEDKGSGALHHLEKSVMSVRNTLAESIKIKTEVAKEVRRIEATMKQQMEFERQRLEKMLAQQCRESEEKQKQMRKDFKKTLSKMETESKRREVLLSNLKEEREKCPAIMKQQMEFERQRLEKMLAQQCRESEEKQKQMRKDFKKTLSEMEKESRQEREILLSKLKKEEEKSCGEFRKLQEAYENLKQKANESWPKKLWGFIKGILI